MQNKEKIVINKAVRQLEKNTGFETILHFYGDPEKPDVVLDIINNDYNIEFHAEIRLYVNRARLGILATQLRAIRGVPILITEYVNPALMNTMEENGINFIDAAGNALIKVPPLFIKLKGNKPDDEKKTEIAGKTFSAAALRVIFALLCNPEMERRTIREIEEITKVATGTVYNTIQHLIELGYLLNNQEYHLINKKDLLERWVTDYPEKLKPKYLIGKYDIKPEQINSLELEKYNALWGGEEAAARLTNYLRPFLFTIYIAERQGEFILRNRLRTNPNGNLILIRKFWNFDNYEYPDITHPILIYADLMATGDPRNIETAKIIYEKEIVRYIREN